jgi:hypothetical protein
MLGTGGSPGSVYRAAELGVPMFLGILGGTPEHWSQYGLAYTDAWIKAGHKIEDADVAVHCCIKIEPLVFRKRTYLKNLRGCAPDK